MKKNLVCRECGERYIGCHAKCEKYINECAEIQKEKEKIWKTQDIDRAMTGIEINRTWRAKGVKK